MIGRPPKKKAGAEGKMTMENWVQARGGCSLSASFQVLREMIDNDVKAANALKRHSLVFELNVQAAGKLIVIRHHDIGGIDDSATVVFEMLADKITVSARTAAASAVLFSMAPFLNEDGECRFGVNGQDLEFWQVRRMALEDLFFAL